MHSYSKIKPKYQFYLAKRMVEIERDLDELISAVHRHDSEESSTLSLKPFPYIVCNVYLTLYDT